MVSQVNFNHQEFFYFSANYTLFKGKLTIILKLYTLKKDLSRKILFIIDSTIIIYSKKYFSRKNDIFL